MKNNAKALIVIGIMVAILAFIFAIRITPWFYAINTRVRLYLDAPAETRINICWNKKKSECLPLVPYSSINNRAAQMGEEADVWLSELPPRPVYFISLQFKSGVDKAKFNLLELDSSNIFLQGYGKGNGAGVNNIQLLMDDFEFIRIASLPGDLSFFESKDNSFLVHDKEIASGPVDKSGSWVTTLFIWVLLFSTYLWIALPVSLLPDAINNHGSANHLISSPKYSWLVYLGCIAAGIFMILLVKYSGVLVYQYDPLSYLLLATGEGWFNVSRLPGYPLFLGFALLISGNSLDGVILLQVVIFVLSVLFCLWILRKWISPYVAVPFVTFALFSPVQVTFARWILRESLFASLVVLGVTAVIAHFTSRKPYSDRWLIFFTVICGVAFLIRENGIILPFALLPVLAILIIKRLFSSGTIVARIRSVLLLLLLYLLPVAAIATVYIGFSAYNYQHFGYFQLEEQQTSHGFLSKAMSPANFDARGLLKPVSAMDADVKEYLGRPLYSSYILSRDQSPGNDQTYSAFYPYMNAKMNELGLPASQFTAFHQASLLNAIGKNVYVLIPRRAILAGSLRQYISLLNPQQSYALDEVDISNAPVLLKELPVDVTIDVEDNSVGVNNILAGYYQITQSYKWYDILFVLALFFSFYILKYEDPVFLAPMAVYLANCALVLYSRMVAARVFVNIDVLLVLQVALGLSLWLYRNFNIKTQELK
jgi:hypothetical protein